MKKNFLCLFTVLCTLSFFTACGDDDDPIPTPTPDPEPTPEQVLDVNATYSEDKLALKYGDSDLLGKEVSFATEDGKTATITMKGTMDLAALMAMFSKADQEMFMAPGVIPGEVKTTLSDVKLTLSGEKYTFEGEYTGASGVKASYSGEVQKDKLTMAVKATMPSNDLVGTWALAPFAPTADPASMPIVFNWETSTPIMIDGSLIGMDAAEMPIPVNQLLQFLNAGKVSPLLVGALQSVTYQEDGNIVASYKKAGATDWETSPINLAQYYIADGKMYVQLNITQIIALVQSTKADGGLSGITQLLPLLSSGVPLDYTIANGVAQISAGKDLLLPILGMMTDETIGGMIMGAIPENMKPLAQGIVAQLPGILATTTDVSSTLILVKQQ